MTGPAPPGDRHTSGPGPPVRDGNRPAEDLRGTVVLITGATGAQGLAHTALLSAHGATVVATDLALTEHAGAARAAGAAMTLRLDVTSEADWTEVCGQVLARFGRIDVLVNNAGVARVAPIEQETLDGFNQVLAVNLTGVFLGIRSVLGAMRHQGSGSIVNIASVAGRLGIKDRIAYSASKAGVRGLTKTAAYELAPYGIRVNSILPGPIRSAMLPDNLERVVETIPLGRVGEPGDVAELVLFLASPRSSFVTGSELLIDGGLTCGRHATIHGS